jgi:hypothetical protein
MRELNPIAVVAVLLIAAGSTALSCSREDGDEESRPTKAESPDSPGTSSLSDSSMAPPDTSSVLIEIVKGISGRVVFRVDNGAPDTAENKTDSEISDTEVLESFLVRRKNEFQPAEDAPVFRVLIRQGKGVDFKEVLAVLKVCEKAGVTNIRFEAAPDPITEKIERLEREEGAAKQK